MQQALAHVSILAGVEIVIGIGPVLALTDQEVSSLVGLRQLLEGGNVFDESVISALLSILTSQCVELRRIVQQRPCLLSECLRPPLCQVVQGLGPERALAPRTTLLLVPVLDLLADASLAKLFP